MIYTFFKYKEELFDNIIATLISDNESYNFLAAQIGETALLQIEQTLEEKITKTYTKTIFDKIDEVADDLADASEATSELNNSANDLKVGSKMLNENLLTLSGKTIKFDDGVNQTYSGSSDLLEEANMSKFTTNFAEANDGNEILVNGTNSLYVGMFELKSGSFQLNDAAHKLASGSAEIYDGMDTLAEGMGKFNQEMFGAADKTNGLNATSRTKNMIANPVDVQNEKINEVSNYGLDLLLIFYHLDYLSALYYFQLFIH